MKLFDTFEMMNSSDYKERFRAEYYQLLIRVEKLSKMLQMFQDGDLPFNPECPEKLLEEQREIMWKYLALLRIRAEIEQIQLEEITIE